MFFFQFYDLKDFLNSIFKTFYNFYVEVYFFVILGSSVT